jgi:hypothetical protein
MPDDVAFVNGLLERYYAWAASPLPAQEDPEGGGVPPAMQHGPLLDGGWIHWRLCPGTVREADLDALEREFGFRLPPLLRAYFRAHHHLFSQGTIGDHSFFVSDTPVNNPLREFRRHLEGWRPLLPAGLVPFGDFGDCYGPLCVDVLADDGRGPVVWIDFETPVITPAPGEPNAKPGVKEALALWPRSPPEDWPTRGVLEPHLQPVLPSLREFLEQFFRER